MGDLDGADHDRSGHSGPCPCIAESATPTWVATSPPHAARKGLLRNVEELAGKGVTLQVIPLQRPGSKFGFEAVWQHIFDKVPALAGGFGGGGASNTLLQGHLFMYDS